MLKFSAFKNIFIQKLTPYRIGGCYISTSKLKGDKEKIFLKALKTLDSKPCGPENSQVFLQTVGSGAYGAPQSLFVQSHFHRFLFNCGEGTRRICRENKIDFENLTGVFFTSCSWKHISGIPAFQAPFTNNNEKKYVFNLYGPAALKNFFWQYSELDSDFDTSRRCYVLNSEDIIFKESLVIKPVPLFLEGSEKLSLKNTSSKYILAYICTFPTRKGRLCPHKLVSAGVPPGPLVNCLKNGAPVKLANGKVVTPLEVSLNPFEESTFIVLEIPTVEYLEALISRSDFDQYKKLATRHYPDGNNLKVIVHFSPPDVMKDSRYRQWVNSFSPSVSHIVINNRSYCLGLQSPVQMQLQLNQILPSIFPLHRNPGVQFVKSEGNIPFKDEPLNPLLLTSEYQFNGPAVQSSSALLYHVRPYQKFDSSSCPVVNSNETINSSHGNSLILKSLNDFNVKFNELKLKRTSAKGNHYPKFLFLGTGSGFSSGIRNTSGILIKLCSENNVLLDCGEGTFNQLIRFLGKDETMSTLRKLKFIFISHKHQDHHMGLISLLDKRRESFMELGIKKIPNLYVLASQEIIRFLKNAHYHFNLDFENIVFINNIGLAKKNHEKLPLYEVIKSLQLEEISVAYVVHVKNSFGIALTHKDGWKIVYSGDTMPSSNLVSIGRNCDLLIHEATHEDGMEKQAILSRHSTFSQAIQVGKEMNAKFTILTHFSQRYLKIPIFEEEILKENVGIAFDCMKVTFEDLPYLRYLYPALKQMFIDDYHLLNTKRFQRDGFI